MTSPATEFQAALTLALKSDPAVMAIAKGIYDEVPKVAAFPYVSFGPVNSVPRDSSCTLAADHTIQIDTWSRAVGSGESYDLNNAVKRAIHAAALTVPVNALGSVRVVSVRSFKEGTDETHLTRHGVVTVQAMIEER